MGRRSFNSFADVKKQSKKAARTGPPFQLLSRNDLGVVARLNGCNHQDCRDGRGGDGTSGAHRTQSQRPLRGHERIAVYFGVISDGRRSSSQSNGGSGGEGRNLFHNTLHTGVRYWESLQEDHETCCMTPCPKKPVFKKAYK